MHEHSALRLKKIDMNDEMHGQIEINNFEDDDDISFNVFVVIRIT